MTGEELEAELAERLRAALDATIRRRKAKLDAQAEFQRRRAHGLRIRHQTKLNRKDRP